MKIKTKVFLKELSGKEIEQLTVGEAISNVLIASKEGTKIKNYVLGSKFFSDNEVELDEADLSMVKKAIEKCEIYTNLVCGQLLVMLEDTGKNNI